MVRPVMHRFWYFITSNMVTTVIVFEKLKESTWISKARYLGWLGAREFSNSVVEVGWRQWPLCSGVDCCVTKSHFHKRQSSDGDISREHFFSSNVNLPELSFFRTQAVTASNFYPREGNFPMKSAFCALWAIARDPSTIKGIIQSPD